MRRQSAKQIGPEESRNMGRESIRLEYKKRGRLTIGLFIMPFTHQWVIVVANVAGEEVQQGHEDQQHDLFEQYRTHRKSAPSNGAKPPPAASNAS